MYLAALMSDRLNTLFPERRDLLWLCLAVVAMWATTPLLGAWEPWEADQASVADSILEHHTWLQVRVPTGPESFRQVAELPFGHWPVMAACAAFGTHAMSLRLPGLLLGIATVLLLFVTTRRFFDRASAWLAALGLLTMPLFSYHARFALGAGVSASLIALGALCLIRRAVDDEAGPRWAWAGWLLTAGAGLSAGVHGFAAPALAGLVAAWVRALHAEQPPKAAFARIAPPAAAGVAVALVALGWWRASVYMPEDASLADLLLWADPLGPAGSAAKRPTFETFVHQIGFGLFPLGALLPLAFAELLWHPDAGHGRPEGAWLPPALAAWFAVCFLGPATGAPFTHLALFTGAPAVAMVVGVYFGRVLRAPPQPLLALTAVALLALLDSNLKHDTQLLADSMVGAKVDAFPPKLAGWKLARLLNVALLGILLLYQGGVRHLFSRAGTLAYPKAPPRAISFWTLVAALALGGVVFGALRGQLEALVAAKFWAGMKPWARQTTVVVTLLVACYGVAHFAWRWRAKRVEKLADAPREDLFYVQLGKTLERLLDRAAVPFVGVVLILVGWGFFQNGWIAHALTDNFSQKGLTEAFADRAKGDEKLYKYRVDDRNSTFYTRDLDELKATDFKELASGGDRFFAIVPRDQLAKINTEFRKATTRTLPVLDDRSFRFLLVSNQLGAGEEDRNPITRALVKEVPGDANKVAITFRERDKGDDLVQLVGWKLDPEQPSPGSPMTMTLYWKVLKNVRGSWKVFVHIDAAGQRIHGDHDPVAGLYPTGDWTPGDIIADEHHVVVKRTVGRGRYTFYAGLYRGNSRMKVAKGPKDNDNRARLGYVRVR